MKVLMFIAGVFVAVIVKCIITSIRAKVYRRLHGCREPISATEIQKVVDTLVLKKGGYHVDHLAEWITDDAHEWAIYKTMSYHTPYIFKSYLTFDTKYIPRNSRITLLLSVTIKEHQKNVIQWKQIK